MRRKRGILCLALALALCLAGCAYEKEVSPTADYDGTWYFAVNGAECKFADGQIYRYDKNALDGQSLTGIYSAAGDHIDANVTHVGGVDKVRSLYIVSGDNGDVLCDQPDGSGTVYFYREAEAYLAAFDAALAQPSPAAAPSPQPTSPPGEVLTLEPLDPDDPAQSDPPEARDLPAAQPDPEPTPESRSGGGVWIPQSGSKYHSTPSCSGMKDPRQVTLSEAQSKGYTPCKRCY